MGAPRSGGDGVVVGGVGGVGVEGFLQALAHGSLVDGAHVGVDRLRARAVGELLDAAAAGFEFGDGFALAWLAWCRRADVGAPTVAAALCVRPRSWWAVRCRADSAGVAWRHVRLGRVSHLAIAIVVLRRSAKARSARRCSGTAPYLPEPRELAVLREFRQLRSAQTQYLAKRVSPIAARPSPPRRRSRETSPAWCRRRRSAGCAGRDSCVAPRADFAGLAGCGELRQGTQPRCGQWKPQSRTVGPKRNSVHVDRVCASVATMQASSMRWVWRVRQEAHAAGADHFAAVDPAGGDGVLDVAAAQHEADRPGRMIVQGAIVVVAQEMMQVEIRQPADDARDRAVDARRDWRRPWRAGAPAGAATA
jgi:hypothetical protein